jgi:hypothetical protein
MAGRAFNGLAVLPCPFFDSLTDTAYGDEKTHHLMTSVSVA